MDILGTGNLENEIIQKIKMYDIEDVVQMRGYCNNTSDYFLNADIMLLPSFSEGLPTVMIEAQAYGCAVIASNRITRECDLQIDRVEFCDICDSSLNCWEEKILKFGKKKNVKQTELIEKINEKGFSTSNVYKKYIETLSIITGVNIYD